MKIIWASILVLSATGCITLSGIPSSQRSTGASLDSPAATPSAPTPPISQTQSIGPRLVIPATGGAPVMGIHLGGSLYLPVTGGPPVVGMPIAP